MLQNLANLEKELKNIKSARILTEETVASYRDTQKEIARLCAALSEADAGLVTISKAFETQNLTLCEKLDQGLERMDERLVAIGNEFEKKCEDSGSAVNKSFAIVFNDFKRDCHELINNFTLENARFKENINLLVRHHEEFENTLTKILEIEKKIDELQSNINGKAQKERIYNAENHQTGMNRLDELEKNLAEKAHNIISAQTTANEAHIDKITAIQKYMEERFKNVEEQIIGYQDNLLERINLLKISTDEKIKNTNSYIAEINLNNSNKVQGLQKLTEEGLQKIESAIKEERKKCEEEQKEILKSEKKIQIWLVILFIMAVILIISPFLGKYINI